MVPPLGTNVTLPHRRGKRHLYWAGTPPGTNARHSYEYLARYKCAPAFVPENLYGSILGTNEG